jgi:hypothetical protein
MVEIVNRNRCMAVANVFLFLLFSFVATILIARRLTRIQLNRLAGIHERESCRLK